MIQVKEIFSQLQSTNSKLEKQRIIRENKDNEKFKDTLVFLLNPYVLTGISERKINKKVEVVKGFCMDWETLKENIAKHNTGTDNDIAIVQQSIDYFSNGDKELKDFYKGLITKSLKIGCDAKTVNCVIPNLIPEFNIMLANKYFDKPERVKGEFTLTEKLDGFRLVTVIYSHLL